MSDSNGELGDVSMPPTGAGGVGSGEGASRIYERDTDALLVRLLRTDVAFAHRFTAFCGLGEVEIVGVRGQQRHCVDTGTIDIVVALRGGGLLLVENKIDAAYSVTRAGHGQPERYQRSVETFRRAGAHAQSVLVAPARYLAASRFKEAFDLHISYEDFCGWARADDRQLLMQAIEQAEAPYEPLPNEGAGEFFGAMRSLVEHRYPDLAMKHDPNPNGVRPAESRTIYFDVRHTLVAHVGVPPPRMSLQCWDKSAPSASVKIMLGGCAGLSGRIQPPQALKDIGGYLRPAGRSLGIVVDTPRLDTQRSPEEQISEVTDALDAALRLQLWWRESPEFLTEVVGMARS